MNNKGALDGFASERFNASRKKERKHWMWETSRQEV